MLEQFNSFSKMKTPDDGQLRQKYVVSEEEEKEKSCILTVTLMRIDLF
jgi:hypothetical protein